MRHLYKKGNICASGKYWETVAYDIANEKIGVRLDGRGGLLRYRIINDPTEYASSRAYLGLFVDGKKIDPYCNKRVEMLGYKQKIILTEKDYSVSVLQFLSPDENGIFYEIDLKAKRKVRFDWSFDCGNGGNKPIVGSSDGVFSYTDGSFCIATSEMGNWTRENHTLIVSDENVKEKRYRFCVAYGANAVSLRNALSNFSSAKDALEQLIREIKIPERLSEAEKAFYYSCYFCALENFKSVGAFDAFCAGVNYMNTVRTYFRDSYWTTLPMYNGRVDLVRKQILTLSRGIQQNGDCPSAVVHDFSSFWGNHFDSPSFYAMMLYDYINHTGDISILDERIGETTVFEKAVRVMEKLGTYADGTGLIYKKGPYNKRDWADEVNRDGYVTYVEILYARSLFCLSELCGIRGDSRREVFAERSRSVADKINELLWDNEKGYYVNYRDGDFTEDNLSVDTAIAVIFGIADGEKSKRLLDNMERFLETRNNKAQRAGDYGVMCVWPFYKRYDATFKKSSQYYEYHNGGNWPYWSALYAYARALCGMEYGYALTSWFDYNVRKGNYTPIEYFSPCRDDGSLLQAWSGVGAFVMERAGKENFFAPAFFARNQCGRR